MVTDAQVRKLMNELSKDGNVSRSAMKADMDRKTARRYRDLGVVPSEAKKPRTWRTREDPFEADWPEIEARLRDAPGLEAKSLLEFLMAEKPDRYDMSSLRTLQRRLRTWRASNGPEKRVYLPQEHIAGEAMQTDFTWMNELGVTIAGEPYAHMLCHVILPYSNWQWATVCKSESLSALKRGVQEAVRMLGGVTVWHQTDNSTSATHHLGGKREFNEDYLVLMRHLGMKPRTIAIGKKEQNGDVESLNGAIKRKVEQHLLLRGSRHFDSVEAYEAWLWRLFDSTNRTRGERLVEERASLRPPPSTWLPLFTEESSTVTSWSTVRVRRNTYSVPSRLRGEKVRVLVYDERIEVWYAGKQEANIERLRGDNGHRIDYRHVIWSLVQHPAGFARYKYREDLFPTLVFRRTYDALVERLGERAGAVQYLRVLHLAASTMQADVEAVLAQLLDDGARFNADTVKGLLAPADHVVPTLAAPEVSLGDYDALLTGVAK